VSHDFIVIGVGHNGLACAAYLARSGARVLCWSAAQAPACRHTAVVWQYAPYALEAGAAAGWRDARQECAAHLLELWRSCAPNITRDKILGMKIQDPTDTERLNDNLVNGVEVVGDMTPNQMGYFRPFAGWSSYRSPVVGLYMCGGYCHPGGGVHAGARAEHLTMAIDVALRGTCGAISRRRRPDEGNRPVKIGA
jgi:phytoene dehydrogenase-like protein